MTPDEYRRAKRIFVQALRADAAERHAFLEKACGGDPELRREVESLLSEDGRASAFSPVPLERRIARGDRVQSRTGTYRIEEELGRGSAGVVYRATDCELERPVAIKFLRQAVAGGEDLSRFEREAKLLARLNHPNIVTLHSIGETTGGLKFLVLELIEGEDLSTHIRRRHVPAGETLGLCRQLAEALREAHDRGVIHRDLKPENVIVTPDGTVKVHDFGLARATGIDAEVMSRLRPGMIRTGRGVLMGSPGYMSPEQICGQHQDRRTDIFSFGCLLFECLSGKMAFPGENLLECLSATLGAEPDWSALPPSVPRRIRALLPGLLAKDPRARLADMGEVCREIDAAGREGQPFPPGESKGPAFARRAALLGGTAAAVSVLCFGAWWALDGGGPAGAGKGDPPLRVASLRVEHFQNRQGRAVHRGNIGEQSFAAAVDDDVRVSLGLSESAYCYLIAYNPDGGEQLCHPADPGRAPPPVKEVQYPEPAKGFGLTDGAGLQVFVALASRKRLPAYATWRSSLPVIPWRTILAGGVWRFDRRTFQAVGPRGASDRGPERPLRGIEPLRDLWSFLKSRREFTAMEAIAFPVLESSDPVSH